MNKKIIGEHLRKLRTDKGYSQRKLCEILYERYGLYITPKSIIDWEKGKNTPLMENLPLLADLYEVSINEIISGEKPITLEQLKDKYPCLDTKRLDGVSGDAYFDSCFEIRRRIKTLACKYIRGELTQNEDIEFSFIYRRGLDSRKFELSTHAKDTYHIDDKCPYEKFLMVLSKSLKHYTNPTDKEIVWELQKLILGTQMRPSGYFCCNVAPEIGDEDDKGYSECELWTLDAILARFQNKTFVQEDIFNNRNASEDYLKRYGENYTPEQVDKDIIKYLIKKGARLNSYFFVKTLIKKRRLSIVDTLDDIYQDYLKPTVVNIENNGKTQLFSIKSTRKNFFLMSEEFHVLSTVLNHFHSDDAPIVYTPDMIYRLICEHDEMDETIIGILADVYELDKNRPYETLKEEVLSYNPLFGIYFKKYKEKEREYLKAISTFDELKKKLDSGELTYIEVTTQDFGPTREKEYETTIERYKSKLSYSEFLSYRDEKKSKKLLEEIDSLSIQEIRDKYFNKEVIVDEEL